jgi:hypothetical protein
MVVLLTLAGLGLRCCRLDNQSLWTDEISSIKTARAPMDQIYWRSAEVNNSLPSYFLVLRWVLGDADNHLALRGRGLSALAGALTIPVLFGVVYLWRRQRQTALWAGLLLAANPLHLWYSQEVRAYALMTFIGLLSVLFFELAREYRRLSLWGCYVASAVVAISLHKTALVFPAFCGLWHARDILRRQGRRATLLVHVPIAVFMLLVLLLQSYPPTEGQRRPSSPLEIAYTFMTFVGGYSFGPAPAEIQAHGAWLAVARHPLQVGILVAVLSLAAVAYVLNFRAMITGKETMMMTLGIGVVAVYALVSGFPYNVRYALSALLAFLALLAGLAAFVSNRTWGRVALAGVLGISVWADVQWFCSPVFRKGDSRAVARWLVAHQDQVKSWTVLPGYLSSAVEWYLQSNPEMLSRACAPKQDETTTFPPVPDVLIIGRRHHIQQPDRLIAAYHAAAGSVTTNLSCAGFELYVRQPGRLIRGSGSP